MVTKGKRKITKGSPKGDDLWGDNQEEYPEDDPMMIKTSEDEYSRGSDSEVLRVARMVFGLVRHP